MKTTLIETGTSLKANIIDRNKANNKIKLDRESMITLYLVDCEKFINQELTTKDGKPLSLKAKLSSFKSDLLSKIDDTDKLTNSVITVFNSVLSKRNGIKVSKLKLMDFSTLNKYSKLSNGDIKGLDYTKTAKALSEDITSLYKDMMIEKKYKDLKEFLARKENEIN